MAEDAEGVGHLLEPLAVVCDGQNALDVVAELGIKVESAGFPVAEKP